MKSVEFNGKKYEVEEWARFITMDDYGNVEVWNNPPAKHGMKYLPVFPPTSKSAVVDQVKQMDRYKRII